MSDSQSINDLQELLSCASFMGTKSLVRLVAAKIASMMHTCRNIDQIRGLFGIENDFTPAI